MPQDSLTLLSRSLGSVRWAFMPLGLLALIAVGVHAAADTLDDRLLTAVDAFDTAFDALVSRSPVTESLVDLLSLERRTHLARWLALGWELAADGVLALPALGYREAPLPADAWREGLRRFLRAPAPLRWIRPLCTALVVVAGACAVARLVEGTVFLSWRELLGEAVARGVARGLALGVLGGLGVRLGSRAVGRSFQHADEAVLLHGRGFFRALTLGLPGSALVVPLALAAFLDASPLRAFLS